MDEWTASVNLDYNILTENFNKCMSNFIEPLKIGPYQLKSSDIIQLLEPTFELNDEQLNAHLYVTTTLSNDIILFDSIAFTKYYRRGFKKFTEFLDQQWFMKNIIFIPIHYSRHWFLFVIDITKRTILLFDSLPCKTTPYEVYQKAILQLLRTHYFYVKKSPLDFNDWMIIKDFPDWKQDDPTSCGIHCALFAQSYATSTKHQPINNMNIKSKRIQFALHLFQQNKT